MLASIETATAPLRKLCFLVLHSGASNLDNCATPLTHALTASAMECDVEMHFIGPGARLLAAGAADAVLAGSPPKALAALLDDARDSAVRRHACTSVSREPRRPRTSAAGIRQPRKIVASTIHRAAATIGPLETLTRIGAALESRPSGPPGLSHHRPSGRPGTPG